MLVWNFERVGFLDYLKNIIIISESEISQNIKEQFLQLNQSCEEKEECPNIIVTLALIEVYDLGIEKNYKNAMALFEKAAEMKHAVAINNLGVMYERCDV